MYKGKEKIGVEDDEIPRRLERDPPIKPTRMEMEIMLKKELENWFAHDIRRMQYFYASSAHTSGLSSEKSNAHPHMLPHFPYVDILYPRS